MTEETETKIHPVSASADGARNAYSMRCLVHGQSRPYAVCVSLLGRAHDPVAQTLYSGCLAAIAEGSCQAIAMREQELLAGRAIFFLERNKGPVGAAIDKVNELVASGRIAVTEGLAKGKTKPATAPANSDGLAAFAAAAASSYADAINHVLSAPAPAPKTPEIVVPAAPPAPIVAPVAGETPMAAARRMLAARNARP